MELIDREAIAQNAQTYSVEYGEYIGDDVRELEMVLLSRVMSAPIIDAVPVVRCRECRYGLDLNGKIACTECRERIHGVNDYCSYGERKDALNAEKGNEHDR